jgi:hypothetical protein
VGRYQIVTATIEHACALCPRVREADIEEFHATGMTVDAVLSDGLKVSTYAWAGLIDGEVACIFGVASPSVLSGEGVPWMVGSDLLDLHAHAFLRRSRRVVSHMLSLYDHLENYVDSRNTRAVHWLRWLGFTLHAPEPHGPQGVPFHRFEMRRGHV